jgi:hypothetical protein
MIWHTKLNVYALAYFYLKKYMYLEVKIDTGRVCLLSLFYPLSK